MVAVALATLFAVVRRPDLSSALSQPCLQAIFQESLRRIVDPRLGSAVAANSVVPSPASQESAKETAQQVQNKNTLTYRMARRQMSLSLSTNDCVSLLPTIYTNHKPVLSLLSVFSLRWCEL